MIAGLRKDHSVRVLGDDSADLPGVLLRELPTPAWWPFADARVQHMPRAQRKENLCTTAARASSKVVLAILVVVQENDGIIAGAPVQAIVRRQNGPTVVMQRLGASASEDCAHGKKPEPSTDDHRRS